MKIAGAKLGKIPVCFSYRTRVTSIKMKTFRTRLARRTTLINYRITKSQVIFKSTAKQLVVFMLLTVKKCFTRRQLSGKFRKSSLKQSCKKKRNKYKNRRFVMLVWDWIKVRIRKMTLYIISNKAINFSTPQLKNQSIRVTKESLALTSNILVDCNTLKVLNLLVPNQTRLKFCFVK